MTIDTWIIIVALALTNVIALVGGLLHVATKLTRIDTTLQLIKERCPQCQPTLDRNIP
jgi:hypothetical protein